MYPYPLPDEKSELSGPADLSLMLPSLEAIRRFIVDPYIINSLSAVYDAPTVYKRFDSLCELIHACKNTPIEPIQNLKQTALQFAMAIVDACNEAELGVKTAHRERYKVINPDYMPWHIPLKTLDLTQKKFYESAGKENIVPRKQYLLNTFRNHALELNRKTYSLVPGAAEEDKKNKIIYLSAPEREEYRVFPHNGKLKYIKTSGVGNDRKLSLVNFSSEGYWSHTEKDQGKAIFVISHEGDIFAASVKDKKFCHSSLLAGAPLFFSGTLSANNGRVWFFNGESGHYRPKYNRHLISFFNECGLLNNKMPLPLEKFDPFARFNIIEHIVIPKSNDDSIHAKLNQLSLRDHYTKVDFKTMPASVHAYDAGEQIIIILHRTRDFVSKRPVVLGEKPKNIPYEQAQRLPAKKNGSLLLLTLSPKEDWIVAIYANNWVEAWGTAHGSRNMVSKKLDNGLKKNITLTQCSIDGNILRVIDSTNSVKNFNIKYTMGGFTFSPCK